MNRYERFLSEHAGSITLRQIESLSKHAEQSGRLWILGRALVSVWSFETGNQLANHAVISVLVRSGLRREVFDLVSNSSFPGKQGCLLRLKQLFPLDVDRADIES